MKNSLTGNMCVFRENDRSMKIILILGLFVLSKAMTLNSTLFTESIQRFCLRKGMGYVL